MIKFVVHSVKGITSIVEVECEMMPKSYSYSLKEGEWMAKITAPSFMYEKDKVVENKMVPPIWCWWAFHDSVYGCVENLRSSLRGSIARAREKEARLAGTTCEPLTAEELEVQVTEVVNKIPVIRLQKLKAI